MFQRRHLVVLVRIVHVPVLRPLQHLAQGAVFLFMVQQSVGKKGVPRVVLVPVMVVRYETGNLFYILRKVRVADLGGPEQTDAPPVHVIDGKELLHVDRFLAGITVRLCVEA